MTYNVFGGTLNPTLLLLLSSVTMLPIKKISAILGLYTTIGEWRWRKYKKTIVVFKFARYKTNRLRQHVENIA